MNRSTERASPLERLKGDLEELESILARIRETAQELKEDDDDE